MVVLQGGWHVWRLFATLQRQHSLPLSSPPSFRHRILKHPCFTGAVSTRAAVFDLVHFKCGLGMKLNYARFNGGQLMRIILVTINRGRPVAHFIPVIPVTSSATFLYQTTRYIIKKVQNVGLKIPRVTH